MCTVHALVAAKIARAPPAATIGAAKVCTVSREFGEFFQRSAAKDPPTERGEALESSNWYAIWTRSHSERLVHEQLAALGFKAFLPELGLWSKRQGQMRVVQTPMFPGYLFVRDSMDKHAYIQMLKVRGLVRILENGWTKLTPVPDDEVSAIEIAMQAGVPMFRTRCTRAIASALPRDHSRASKASSFTTRPIAAA
jgi:transcription antitermination factor NusG